MPAATPISKTGWKRYGAGNGANQQVHEAILRGASECFLRYGVRRTSMDDVAEAAGVSRATVYNYVSNKEMLVAELIVAEAQRINEEARALLDESLPSVELLAEALLLVLERAVASPYAEIVTNPDQVRQTAQVVGHFDAFAREQGRFWAGVFDVVRARGELRPDLDEQEAVSWLSSVSFMLTTGATTFERDRETHRRYLVQFVAPALLAGAAGKAAARKK